jgi:heme iron utilization protein
VGTAEEVKDQNRDTLLHLYLAKHHSMEKFAHSPESALIRIKVKKYFIVRKFQELMEFKPEG